MCNAWERRRSLSATRYREHIAASENTRGRERERERKSAHPHQLSWPWYHYLIKMQTAFKLPRVISSTSSLRSSVTPRAISSQLFFTEEQTASRNYDAHVKKSIVHLSVSSRLVSPQHSCRIDNEQSSRRSSRESSKTFEKRTSRTNSYPEHGSKILNYDPV